MFLLTLALNLVKLASIQFALMNFVTLMQYGLITSLIHLSIKTAFLCFSSGPKLFLLRSFRLFE